MIAVGYVVVCSGVLCVLWGVVVVCGGMCGCVLRWGVVYGVYYHDTSRVSSYLDRFSYIKNL